MFGLFSKKSSKAKKQKEKLAKESSSSQDEQLMDSKRNIRERVGVKERREKHRRKQHDRREMIRFEFKDDRRSGSDRRRENNKAWSKDDIVD